ASIRVFLLQAEDGIRDRNVTGVQTCALPIYPLVNTHLQARMDTYPKRRGVTRVKELTEAGLNVSFGQDDIVDPWNPLGTGNLREIGRASCREREELWAWAERGREQRRGGWRV